MIKPRIKFLSSAIKTGKLVVLLAALASPAFAQEKADKDEDKDEVPAFVEEKETKEKKAATTAKFGVSLNGGLTFSYTDVKPSKSAPIIGVGGHYFATPYLSVNLDVQKGWVRGGEYSKPVTNIMGSDNSFISATLTARFSPVGLVKNTENNKAISFLSGIYGGTGLGFISSSVDANTGVSSDVGAIFDHSGASLLLPIEAGINIPVAKFAKNKGLMVNVNYRVNLCFSDKIDGYVPVVNANKDNDAFNSLTAGLVFNF